MDSTLLRRIQQSQNATSKRREGNQGYNNDLRHMFLARTKRGPNNATERGSTLKRRRDAGSAHATANDGRVKRMRKEHTLPSADSMNSELPPSRREMHKHMKEFVNQLEENNG